MLLDTARTAKISLRGLPSQMIRLTGPSREPGRALDWLVSMMAVMLILMTTVWLVRITMRLEWTRCVGQHQNGMYGAKRVIVRRDRSWWMRGRRWWGGWRVNFEGICFCITIIIVIIPVVVQCLSGCTNKAENKQQDERNDSECCWVGRIKKNEKDIKLPGENQSQMAVKMNTNNNALWESQLFRRQYPIFVRATATKVQTFLGIFLICESINIVCLLSQATVRTFFKVIGHPSVWFFVSLLLNLGT